MPILMVLNCYTGLSFWWLLSNEWMPEKLIRVWSLMIVFHQYCLDERFEFL